MAPDDRSDTEHTDSAPVAALHAFEHKVEAVVEGALGAAGRSLEAAERSLARRLGLRFVHALRLTLRGLFIASIVLYFAFGALFLVTRYWLMPRIDEYRPQLERDVGRLLDARVQVAQIETGWRGFNPHLRLSNVQIFDRSGRPALTLPQLEATLSWTSVPALQAHFRELWILAPELEVQRQADGRFVIGGFIIDPTAAGSDGRLAEWALSQPHIGIRNARVRYTDLAAATPETLEFDAVDLEFRRGVLNNQFAFRARPPVAVGSPLDVRGEYRHPWFERANDVSQWTGRVFLQIDFADVARIARLTHALPATMSIERAQGAVRAWLRFDRMRIEQFTADLALVDVAAQLGANLPPLQVERLQGRVSQREWGTIWEGGQEFSATQLALSGADLALSPTDLRVRVTRAADEKPERGLIEASAMSLTTMSALARHLPIAPAWRDLAARFGLHGDLANLRYTWEGEAIAPALYTLRTRFDGLSMNGQPADPPVSARGRPRPGLPGFENLSGSLELDQRGGAAQIRARKARLEFPGVFEEPRLAFETLNTNVRWSLSKPASASAPPQLELKFESFAASSQDFEVNAQATYRSGGKGPGLIDASGQIVRVAANQVYKLIPLVVGAQTRAWLRDALISGVARDGSFKLKGDLAHFPFVQPASGEFRIAAKIADGTLDYVPLRAAEPGAAGASFWPPITAIDGELLFERSKMEITAKRAQVFGVALASVRATIPEIGAANARLSVDGKASGSLADFVRYVNESPVGGWIGGTLARATASGDAALELKLDMPFGNLRETRVRGAMNFAQNDLTLRDDLPPFSRINGQLEFNERTLRLSDISGNFAGGPFRADIATAQDGAIEISGSGTATAQGARRLVESAAFARLLDRVQGSARYTANVVIRGKRQQIRVESDLVGIAIDVPEPLRKPATEAAALLIDITPRADNADTIRIGVGARLALHIERTHGAGGQTRIERGAIAVGNANLDALAMPERGVRATLAAPRLDADRWLALLEGPAAEGTGMVPDTVAAQVDELVISGKSIANVVLGATRGADGAWLANVDSDHVSGAITWRPPQQGGQGRVSARFARMTIPERNRAQIADLLDSPPTEMPALDVVANDFELAGRKLGRLELAAQNSGSGPNTVWQLQKLELTNPDGRMSATGQWQRESGTGEAQRRRMSLTLALDFSDAGNLLARLGIPGALRGGEGRLEGDIAWRGSPLALDFPTLSGKLKLATAKGQFLKADAGAGRLLSVLSLQSLPRRITLDFRDVFSEGFAFDAINASADVNAGVLSTRDFKMRGVSATVLIEGSADLRKETQNLRVLVVPEINAGSASLMYALLANPAIGLGTFLAQWLLRDPLSRAFSYEYDVTGSWDDPQVKRRESTSSDVVGTTPK